jgi:TolA-binding protein
MKRLIFVVTIIASIFSVIQIANGQQDENIFKVGIGAFKDELYMISEAQFRIIVEQYPNSRYFNEAIYYLTLSQYRNKKYDDALKTISLIKSKYSYIKYYPNVLFLEGKIYYEVGQYKQAIKSFENYLRLFPINEDAPFAQYLMASSYTSLSNYYRAIELLKEIERRYPNSPIVEESKFKLAETYRLSGDLQNSLNEFKDFISKFTNSKYLPDAYYNLGLITFNLSKGTDTNYLQQSASYFQKASEFNSGIKPFALFNAGISFIAIGKLEEARNTFSNLISEFSSYTQPEIKSTVIEGYLNLARIQKELGDTNSAISNYMNVIAYGGENAIKASIELSSLLNSLNRSEEAIKVLEPFTNDTKVLFNYAISLKNKDPNTAESILVSIISNNDKSEIVDNSIVELLKLLISKGNYEKVISYNRLLSDKALSDYTRNFIYLMIGEANLNLKDYKSAISAYSMVKHESLKEDALEGIAYTHYLSENYNLAIKFYSELVTNYKQGKYTERAYYMLGLCYEKIKDTDKAILSHQQNLIYGKDTRYILSSAISLGWIYLRIGKFDDAIGIASKYIETSKENPTIQIQLLEILAWSYDGKKDYKKAVDTFLQIIKSENLNDFQRIRYYNYISLIYEKSGQYQDAINTITRNIVPITLSNNYSNDYVEALGRLTFLYIRQNDINKAKQTVNSLIPYTNIQKTYEYIYRFGEYLYSINQFDDAARMYMIVAKGSTDTDLRDEAYYWGGWALFNAGKIEDAINVFNEFIKISSSSKVPSVLITLGDIMVNRGDQQKAKYYYNIVVNNYKDKPEYNTAVLKLSKLASTSPKTTEVTKKVEKKKPEEKKIEEKPKNIESLISSLEEVSKSKDKESASKAKFELAMIYKSQGNYQKAINLLQEITEEVYNETAAQAQFEIGEILRNIGDYNKAWKEYIKVVYIYKDYKDIVVKAMYYTIYCYVQLKEYENAKKLYEKMERDFYKNPWTEKAKELIK